MENKKRILLIAYKKMILNHYHIIQLLILNTNRRKEYSLKMKKPFYSIRLQIII